MGVRPVPHKTTQPFAANPTRGNPHPIYGDYQPAGHSGVDFGCPVGTPVAAPEDMTITWADWGTKFPTDGDMSHAGLAGRYYFIGANVGIGVIGETGQGAWAMIHLNDTHLNPGDKVKAGDLIGHSGNTGLSTGPHLHLDWIPTPANWGSPLYGRQNPLGRLTEPYRINGHKLTTAAVKAKAIVKPVAKPKGGALDHQTVTDVNGNVRNLKDVLAWRFTKLYEGDEKLQKQIDELRAQLEKKES